MKGYVPILICIIALATLADVMYKLWYMEDTCNTSWFRNHQAEGIGHGVIMIGLCVLLLTTIQSRV